MPSATPSLMVTMGGKTRAIVALEAGEDADDLMTADLARTPIKPPTMKHQTMRAVDA